MMVDNSRGMRKCISAREREDAVEDQATFTLNNNVNVEFDNDQSRY